jgi:integrase/recombinase XerD
MNPIKASLRDYLAVRRALGFQLSYEGRLLERFVKFAERAGATSISTELAMRWATESADAPPNRWARRLGLVRGLARFASASDPNTIVPPERLLPYRYRRVAPYIYHDEQIRDLIKAARRLPSSTGLRPDTYATLIGLYTATGLRTAEAFRMDRDDVDLVHGILRIRESKFGKSRFVPVHASTKRALQRYAEHRDRVFPSPRSPSFFLSERGTRVMFVHNTFRDLARQTGVRRADGKRAPRIYDLRHRFAITSLTRWHRCGADINQRLPELSTYLGHTCVANTYWYLTATPELLRYALRRAERCSPGVRL